MRLLEGSAVHLRDCWAHLVLHGDFVVLDGLVRCDSMALLERQVVLRMDLKVHACSAAREKLVNRRENSVVRRANSVVRVSLVGVVGSFFPVDSDELEALLNDSADLLGDWAGRFDGSGLPDHLS